MITQTVVESNYFYRKAHDNITIIIIIIIIAMITRAELQNDCDGVRVQTERMRCSCGGVAGGRHG